MRTRTQNVKGRNERKAKKKEKEEKERTTRAYPCTRAHSRALASTRKRRAAADFAFCSRCFMRPIASLFQHPFYLPPPAPSAHIHLAIPLTLDAHRQKNRVFFTLLFFARHRYMPPGAIFEALFPGTVYPPLFTMQIKAGPLPSHIFLSLNPAPSD